MRAIALFLFWYSSIFGQQEIVSMVEKMEYPPLAYWNKVAGDVRLEWSGDNITVTRGHPLLKDFAVQYLRRIKKAIGEEGVAIFHFILEESESKTVKTTTLKGDRLDRAVLKLLRLPTQKVVESVVCEDQEKKVNTVDLSKRYVSVRVWVIESMPCPRTLPANLASRR